MRKALNNNNKFIYVSLLLLKSGKYMSNNSEKYFSILKQPADLGYTTCN